MSLPPLVEPMAALTTDERSRTARHSRLAGFGELGQRRIAAAHVVVVGAGGLGSPVIIALSAAGIGTLTVIDDDVVDLSNLQRQVIHRVQDVGAPKTASAARTAADLSATRVVPVRTRVTAENAETLFAHADLVIDGTDTFASREAVAAGCEALGIPLVWGTVQEFSGQATVFWATPPRPAAPVVLSDLYAPGSDAPTCAAVGVLGPLCLQVGSILAIEAIKLITGIGDPLLGRVLLIDALRATQREVPLRTASVTAPGAPAPVAPVRELSDISVVEGVRVVDVRESDEIAADGGIPGARHVPLADVLADPGRIAAPGLVIVCQSGVRARRAADALVAAGFEAAVLAGGMDAWLRTRVGIDADADPRSRVEATAP